MAYLGAMHYRRFGRTDLRLPVLSCGGMRFQYRWEDVDPAEVPAESQANLEAIVHHAFQLGIHHFETARGYRSSEMQLGRVLPQLPWERILVQTKVAPKASPRKFRQLFERSLQHLRLDRRPTFPDRLLNGRPQRPGGWHCALPAGARA